MQAHDAHVETTSDRNRIIVRASLVGIVANILLAACKAAIGLVSNSIAVTLDAVNNLSDALSSVITIVGARLAAKRPDKKHPMGYGRIEYLSAMIVAGIVLYAGITSAVESVKAIVSPSEPRYAMVSLVIIAVAVVVKLVLGRYVGSQGKRADSGALVASGADATFDAILSLSVLVSALLYTLTGISLEAFVGLVISVVIIKAGIEMMTETLDDVLGARTDPETSRRIKEILERQPEVRGAYDLLLSNYGPGKNYASVHLELPDTMTVAQVDALTRRVERQVLSEADVILAGVGVYSHNTGEGEAARAEQAVRETVLAHDWVLQMHGFYLDQETRSIRLDVVMSFDVDVHDGLTRLHSELSEACPEYTFQITPDVDVSD